VNPSAFFPCTGKVFPYHHGTPKGRRYLVALNSIAETWDGLSTDTQLFLRTACLFDAQRVPQEPLLSRLRVEGWDEDLFDIAYDEAKQEGLIDREGKKLRLPEPVAAFIRGQTIPPIPASLLKAHLLGLFDAARTVCDGPGDAKSIEALLDYPTDREAWDDLEHNIEALLVLMGSTVGKALKHIDPSGRRAQALVWFLRALPALEAAAAEADVATPNGAEVTEVLWYLLAQIADSYMDVGVKDEDLTRAALPYLQKAAEVAAKLIDVDSAWRQRSAMFRAALARCLERLGRHEEAKTHHAMVRDLLSAYWAEPPEPTESIIETRGILIQSLVALGQEDEALEWLDRAANDRPSGDDWARRASLAKVAFLRGNALFHVGPPGARARRCIAWLERAARLYESVDVGSTDRDADLERALYMVTVLRLRSVSNLDGPMPATVEPRRGLDEQALAVALRSLDRFLSFQERATDEPATDVSEALRYFYSTYVLDLAARAQHHAGRPAEALALLERGDAIRAGLDDVVSVMVQGREVERSIIRGRCSRACGQMEAAARAFVDA